MAEVVAKNWADRDEWSKPRPEPSVDAEAWLTDCDPARLVWDDILQYWRLKADGDSDWKRREFFFAFSPLSGCWISLEFIREKDGRLSVLCFVPGTIIYELLGDRESARMEEQRGAAAVSREDPRHSSNPDEDDLDDDWWERRYRLDDTFSVWPQAKRHLRNVMDNLEGTLPVREADVDERLLGEIPEPVTDPRLRGKRNPFGIPSRE